MGTLYLSVLRKSMIMLLLLISGNVALNPGPQDVTTTYPTPADFKIRSGIGFVHLNLRSLLPKMDMVRIWVKNTDADVLVISETWLNKSISDKVINIEGYNVFRIDRPKRGGGLVIYIKKIFF